MNQTRSSNQSQGKAKGNKSSKTSTRKSKPQGRTNDRNKGPQTSQRSVGAAVRSKTVNIGMADLEAHRISWLAGYTYVGNGTLGVTDEVSFRPAGRLTDITPGNTGAGMVPVLGADTGIGQTYVTDIEKHFARKRIRQTKIHLVSLQPSTANSCIVQVAPVRGPGSSGDTVTVTTATAAPTLANVMGMSGSKPVASWEHQSVDMTPYIAGGSGAKQNEFAISVEADDSQVAWGGGALALTDICPCAFVVAGTNSTTGLRGTNVHAIIIEQVIDLLDFVGGQTMINPISFTAKTLAKHLSRCAIELPPSLLDTVVAMIQRANEKGCLERQSSLTPLTH